MILPTKHIAVDDSLLNLGALLLKHLNKPKTVTALWEKAREIPEIGTFERFSLALDFLFIIGVLGFEDQIIYRCKK